MEEPTISKWMVKGTEIGNALGLEGKFCVDFGFDQMLARAHELRALELRVQVSDPLPAVVGEGSRWIPFDPKKE